MFSAIELIWLTQHESNVQTGPINDIAVGLFRFIQTENQLARIVNLKLEATNNAVSIAQHVNVVTRRTLLKPLDRYETEYEERRGRLCINRVVEASYLNDQLGQSSIRKPRLQKFGEETQALALRIGSIGLLDTLEFVKVDRCEESLRHDEVEVKVKAVGVNFKDILSALGQLSDEVIGLECFGIVTRASAGLKVAPGDRVCVTALNTYRTYVRIPVTHVHKILDMISFAEAAAFPVVYCTAYQAIHDCARLQPGESILIHSGAGGTGQAAIQLSKLRQAKIFVTVGSNEKKKLLMDLYDILEDHIFSSRSMSFAKGVKRMTNGRGVDVVLNSLSGESLQQSWECLAPFGRFVEIGRADILEGSRLSMLSFDQNRTFIAINLVHMLKERPEVVEKTMQFLTALAGFSDIGLFQPLHIYKSFQIEETFRYLQGGNNTGKTVVKFDDNDILSVNICILIYSRDHWLIIMAGIPQVPAYVSVQKRHDLHYLGWLGRDRQNDR